MKKRIAWILLCIMLAGLLPAFAEPLTPQKALELISNQLTEVYSYTAEEAAQFTTAVSWEEDRWLITFSPGGHPEWVYTATYKEGDPRIENAVTPFWQNERPENYPGEGSVREGLRRARKNGWFVIWEDHMRQELEAYMKNFGITPTPRLSEGLATGSLSAGSALHEFFVSCYGDEMYWTPELKQWHDEEMAFYGFTYSKNDPVSEGIKTYTDAAYNDLKVELTRFVGEVPEALEQVFSHPQLEGWTCLCGATAQNAENRYGYGLAAFEKEGERLLAGMKYDMEASQWTLSPISRNALYTDRKMHIQYESAQSKNKFTIVYESEEGEAESFEVLVGSIASGDTDAYIQRYTRMNEETGSGFMLEFNDYFATAAIYENHQKKGEESFEKPFSSALSMLDISTFPATMEEWKTAEKEVIPEGYALVRGVHLRKSTSSRSRDLGEYNGGVLAKVLGTEPGDPWAWYHVQIGQAEGYMASTYLDEVVTQDTAYVLDRGLPIAKAQKEIKLKKGMGWLNGTIQTIPEGTLMHVLADCDGGWLHVSIPQDGISWQMDVNGTDGYVKKADVLIGGTPLALEWVE